MNSTDRVKFAKIADARRRASAIVLGRHVKYNNVESPRAQELARQIANLVVEYETEMEKNDRPYSGG